MTPAESERRFDELMRRKIAADEVEPSAAIWPAVSATLPPPRTPWTLVGTGAFLGMLIGMLVGWWAGPGVGEKGHFQRPRATGIEKNVAGIGKMIAGVEKKIIGSGKNAAGGEKKAIGSETKAAGGEKKAIESETKLVATTAESLMASPTVPVGGLVVAATPSLWQVALTQDSAIRQEGAAAVVPARPDSASELPALVAVQRATLQLLQRQLDSLKAALPAEPTALPVAAIAPVAVAPDSTAHPALPPAHPWALALLADATTPWGVLPGPADRRETLGAANQRSIQIEYQPENARWRLRAGLGDVRQTGQFRAATEQTHQTLVSDTTVSTQLDVFTRVDTTLIIQIDSIPQLNAHINASGQILYYDTLWQRVTRTSYQLIVTNDTVRRTTQSVQTRLETQRARREQQLRPTYRFWTLPVAAQFDVLRRGRWRASLSAGAQVLFFRGGEAPVWVGDGYALRRVGPRGGPFRPVSFALTAALDVRYRLTDRLSLLAGAGGRGWVVNPVRGDDRRLVQPTGQLGVSWGL